MGDAFDLSAPGHGEGVGEAIDVLPVEVVGGDVE